MERGLCSGEAFAPSRMLVEGGPSEGCPVFETESLSPRGVAAPKLWRQMDNLSRQAVVAARDALNDGGYRPGRDELAACGVFFGTGTGPGRVNTEFELGVLAAPDRPNLLLFPNTTLNAAAGHVCTSLGFKGPTTTITTGDISGLIAPRYAVAFVASGRARFVLVVGSDELYPTGLQVLLATEAVTDDVARPFDTRANGSVPAAAAVAILVESAASAAERGVDPYATISGSAVTSQPGPPGRARTARASLGRALALALERSGLGGRPPAAVVADASGVAARDAAEAEAIERCPRTRASGHVAQGSDRQLRRDERTRRGPGGRERSAHRRARSDRQRRRRDRQRQSGDPPDPAAPGRRCHQRNHDERRRGMCRADPSLAPGVRR